MTLTPPFTCGDGSCDLMARSGKAEVREDSMVQTDVNVSALLPQSSVAKLPKVVTMKDIAKVAGVTSMTVSRVMKGDNYVAPATRELVLRIARELNYTTNLAGRALRTGRTGVIAVISGALDQPYNTAMVSCLETLLTRSGYQTKLVVTQSDLEHLIRSTQASVVDGVIITGMHYLLSQLRGAGYEITQPLTHISIVQIGGEDCVQCDLIPALREALQFMMSAGRQRIAYVGIGDPKGNFTASHTEPRTHAYVQEMELVGRTPELISAAIDYDVPGPERVKTLRQYFTRWGCPDAILCVNDDVAIHTYRALMDLGCRIPENTLLVGCDGLPVTAYFEPPLSTIAQPFDMLAATAWKFLQARIAEPNLPPQHACFNAELVLRRSLHP